MGDDQQNEQQNDQRADQDARDDLEMTEEEANKVKGGMLDKAPPSLKRGVDQG
jgi:hypothetical protein